MKNKDTERSPEFWKRKAAMAIGRPELATASDEELDAAHDAHMNSAYRMAAAMDDAPGSLVRDNMPPGPASVANENPLAFTNEKQRSVLLEGLMNEAAHRQGITRDEARRQLRTLRPELFPKKVETGPTPEQICAQKERQSQALALVNEKMEGSSLDYETAFRQVKRENPHLFPTAKSSKKT